MSSKEKIILGVTLFTFMSFIYKYVESKFEMIDYTYNESKLSFEEVTNDIQINRSIKEYCYFITKDIENKKENEHNIKDTIHFTEIEKNIPIFALDYITFKEGIDYHLKGEFFPKLIFIKNNTIVANLPVYDYKEKSINYLLHLKSFETN